VSDLATWLLDRIAEDEAVAREVSAYLLRSSQPESIAHADRWHPARVLAECAAKRRIVEDAINDVRDARRRPGWTMPDAEVDELGRHYRLGVEAQKAKQLPDVLDRTDRLLRLLALPYAACDGYDPSWGVQ
jgi:hypothetical protein